MPRKNRSELPDGIVHVTSRGNRKREIFAAERDFQVLLEMLADVVRRHGWVVHAYCLMPNHFHLLVEVEQKSLSAGMQLLNGRYAQWFNLKYGFVGHLFQGRFGSTAVLSERHLLELSRYIVLNPVRAGLCATAAGWKWSSYLATVGAADVPGFLTVDWTLALFGDDPERSIDRYARFVADGRLPPAVVTRGQTRVRPRVVAVKGTGSPVPSRS